MYDGNEGAYYAKGEVSEDFDAAALVQQLTGGES